MIANISKITLYVNNQEQAERFWIDKMGFDLKLKVPMGKEHQWIEVAPKSAQTTLVLYDKALMKKQGKENNIQQPSIIFSTTDLMKTYWNLTDKGVKVGKVMEYPHGKMFIFQDQDQNDYLIKEEK